MSFDTAAAVLQGGLGKTTIAQNIAHRAIPVGRSVLFVTTAQCCSTSVRRSPHAHWAPPALLRSWSAGQGVHRRSRSSRPLRTHRRGDHRSRPRRRLIERVLAAVARGGCW